MVVSILSYMKEDNIPQPEGFNQILTDVVNICAVRPFGHSNNVHFDLTSELKIYYNDGVPNRGRCCYGNNSTQRKVQGCVSVFSVLFRFPEVCDLRFEMCVAV